MKMLLIAGHGQGDPGAIGNNRSECNLTRNLAVAMQQENLDYDSDLEIVLYDTTKDCYQQSKAGNVPNYREYEYVFEVHFNAASDPSAHGTEILISDYEPSHTVEDLILSKLEKLGLTNRGVKRRNDLLNMNNCVGIGTSYALLETCFITNKSDVEFYLNNYEQVAQAVLEGILEGFGLTYQETEGKTDLLYRVQVGAFQNKENAQKLAEELRNKGYETYVTVR